METLSNESTPRERLARLVSLLGRVRMYWRSTLAIAVGEEPETVEDAYEPFLLQTGLMQRTPRGRVATDFAYRHLGLDKPGQSALL